VLNKQFEKSEFDRPAMIFVVADIEGNYNEFCSLLRKNKVVDKDLLWCFDDGHLVVLGDCFDRGEYVIECLQLVFSLEEQARLNGGCVHFILGNHEIMNLNGDWRYVHPRYISSKAGAPPVSYYENTELWQWLCTKNIIEIIGDILFVHAGVSMEMLSLNLSVPEINRIARPYYTKADWLFSDPALHTIFNSNYSPFWYRGYYTATANEELIDATLKYFNVKSIVTGHTVVDKVSSFFNGKLINVDTDHAAGKSEALLIKKNRFYRIDKDGKREKL